MTAAKALVAFFTALATWLSTALADGAITGPEWAGLALVVATAVAVFTVPNKPAN